MPAVPGHLAHLVPVLMATEVASWPAVGDAEIHRRRQTCDGVTWDELAAVREQFNAYCAELQRYLGAP